MCSVMFFLYLLCTNDVNYLEETVKSCVLLPLTNFHPSFSSFSYPLSLFFQILARRVGPQPKCMGKGKSRRLGVLSTLLGSGIMLPTFFIRPGVTASEDKLRDVEGEDVLEMTENGWADRKVHFHAFQSLVKYKNRMGLEKMLLYLDGGGESLNVDGLSFLAQNNITVVVFPPGTSWKLQPCDTSFYGVLKKIMSCLADKDGVIPSQSNALHYWYRALKYQSTTTKKTLKDWIMTGWRKAGLIPYSLEGFHSKEFVGAGVRIGKTVTAESWKAAQVRFSLTAGEEEELLEKIKTKATIFETPVGRKRLERSLAAVTRTAVVNARDTLLGLIEAREAKEAEVSARAARVALRKAATVAKKALLAEKKAARALEDALGEKAYPTTSSAISSSEAIPTAASRPRKRKRSVSATSVLSDAHVSAETSEIETSSRGRPKKRNVVTDFGSSK